MLPCTNLSLNSSKSAGLLQAPALAHRALMPSHHTPLPSVLDLTGDRSVEETLVQALLSVLLFSVIFGHCPHRQRQASALPLVLSSPLTSIFFCDFISSDSSLHLIELSCPFQLFSKTLLGNKRFHFSIPTEKPLLSVTSQSLGPGRRGKYSPTGCLPLMFPTHYSSTLV